MKISEGVEAQIVVETLLVVSMTSFDLAIVPRRSWTDKLMLDLVTVTEHIKWMNTLGVEEMSKLRPVIRLNDFRSISKEDNCTLYEIYG